MPGGIPAEIAEELRAIGARIEVERTSKIYAALHPRDPYPGVRVTRDLLYGPYERNGLDVFTGESGGSSTPVLVFVHGGGFVRGSKRADDSPFYDNIGVWAANEGLVGVTINYRLAPEHTWPSGIEDLDALVTWLAANVAGYGGDPQRIFLWGHSAGAAHVGNYVAARTQSGAATGLAGAILTSGFYELGDDVSAWAAYYGEDVARYRERSSLADLVRTELPLLVTDAELDDPVKFQAQARTLAEARQRAGRQGGYVHLLGHSHISETYAVGTADRSLSGPVLEFVHTEWETRG